VRFRCPAILQTGRAGGTPGIVIGLSTVRGVAGCLLGVALSTGILSGETNVISGVVTSNITWSGTNLLQGTVVVPDGVLVTIAPGTRLLMDAGAGLRVEGQLQADGTEEQPIFFTRHLAGTSWERLLFAGAADSRLRHCVIEYSDCAGDHKDYYDNDCDPSTPFPSRVYFQAVVALACHLDIEGCKFQNLPDGGATAEGDAIAVISDDPDLPGPASATIRDCEFINIGQGVHTRYAYVRVENCFFTGHRGDNDDVDLYGESTPPPLILNNRFLNPGHDDMINPTRCSAIIVGNVIAGGDDHGIVLRDECSPILINNLIYDCSSAGIAIQNQCDALLINNTIVNCGRGIRFFDHTGRWGPPYCLSPGSGTATILNSIIWNCPTTLELTDSSYQDDPGSHATILHSIIQGGQTRFSVSAASTVAWGDGNLDADPRFADLANRDLRLTSESPAIDAGTDPSLILTNLADLLNRDFEATARPLDGDGSGRATFDMGAYEFLLATADSNADGIPDGWCQRHGLNPVDNEVATGNPDQDPHSTFQEWEADTDPMDPLSYFRIEVVPGTPPLTVQFSSSPDRFYTLFYASSVPDLSGPGIIWNEVPGQNEIRGTGLIDRLADTGASSPRFYRVSVHP
jgi:parallel beta-helix repeat protein